MTAHFFVPGLPVPKGSARAFYHKTAHKVVTFQTNADKQRPWASMIAVEARKAWQGEPTRGPVKVHTLFTMPRPKKHFRTGKHAADLRPDAPYFKASDPDGDKLTRCVWDALTGICYLDDGQVADWGGAKVYGKEPGVWITIEEIPEQGNSSCPK